MEAILTSGEYHLIEGLSFKPPSATAAYVLETRQVVSTQKAETDSILSLQKSSGFRLADHGFLEASSVKFALTLQHKGDCILFLEGWY